MESQENTIKGSGHTQVLVGTIVSTKMMKTVVVEVRTRKRHPKYHKSYTVSKRVKAHAEDESLFQVGDKVQIASTRPISGSKRFKVVKKV
jgi:small subunit ribosomal protein S17